LGLTGIDGKIKSNVSMRGVVSITSTIKLTQSLNGNLAVINNSRRCKFVALRRKEEEDDELRMAA